MKKDLIQYRRERAYETLEDAKILFKKGRIFSTINRIYYAIFYEVVALLLTRDLSSSKHSGTMALFNEHFIKTSLVNTEFGKFYNRMFDFRQKCDYGEFINFEKKKINEWLTTAEQFINSIESVIDSIMGKDS